MNNLKLTQMSDYQHKTTIKMLDSLVYSYKVFSNLQENCSDVKEGTLESHKWTFNGKLEMVDTILGGGTLDIIHEYLTRNHQTSTAFGLALHLGM